MVSTEVRYAQLVRVLETLQDVIGVLRLDAACPYTAHFTECVAIAERLLADGFTQDDLTDLSLAICRTYDGAWTQHHLRDYQPPNGLPGTENFDTFSRVLFERALNLRVTNSDDNSRNA